VTEKTILVVEDDALTAQLVADVIETMGHRVLRADAVDPAFQLAVLHDPVLMLVDVQLGTASGLSLMARLAENAETADIPVVAMTAVDGSDAVADLERAGAVALLEKPFSTEDVVALVTAVIEAGAK